MVLTQQEVEKYFQDNPEYLSFCMRPRDMNSQHLQEVKSTISEMMSDDQSHLVEGGYCLDNLYSRRDNLYIILYSNSSRALLNVGTGNQLIVIGDYDSGLASTISELVNGLSSYFLLLSGRQFEEVSNSIDYTRSLENITFLYRGYDDWTDLDVYIVDDANYDQEVGSKVVEYFGYTLDNQKRYFSDHPHAALIKDEEVVSVARVNAMVEDMAVIGGVGTPIIHRRKGYSKRVMKAFTSYLRRRGLIVTLSTDTNNIAALKVYRSLGYSEVGRSTYVEKGSDIIEKEIIGDRDY